MGCSGLVEISARVTAVRRVVVATGSELAGAHDTSLSTNDECHQASVAGSLMRWWLPILKSAGGTIGWLRLVVTLDATVCGGGALRCGSYQWDRAVAKKYIVCCRRQGGPGCPSGAPLPGGAY